MKKTIPLDSRKAGVLVFVLALGLAVEVAKADFTFGAPQDLGLGDGVVTDGGSAYISVSADELELYFNSDRPGGLGYEDLWVSTRQSVHDPWGPPTNLQTVNSSFREGFPCISCDGLTLYFSDYFYGPDRPGGLGQHDLWFSTRASRNDPWGAPINMGAPFSSSSYEVSPTLSHDGLVFMFGSRRSGGSGGYDLWMCTRPSVREAWGPPVNMGPGVNSGSHDYCGKLSPDGLVLFFESQRSGSYRVWMTMRRTVNDPWEAPVRPPEPMYSMGVGCVSPDASMLYAFMSQVPIVPIVDLNGDGIVEIGDLLYLIESWGQDAPTTDIGPAPWGDGIVDAADLEVLMSYWGQQVDDPTLIAHWTLDETEGDVAYDGAAENDAVVTGDAIWQPEGGQVDGALHLDGIDDCISTGFVLNPADDVFSVFAWIRAGAPGQTIISQEDGADWLLTNTQGYLMTALKSGGRRSGDPLISETIITDGNWHRVGFTWDGSHRILYVDDVEVAHDTLGGLKGSNGGLYIGACRDLEPGTFWSGLIDDVRIYDRVVQP